MIQMLGHLTLSQRSLGLSSFLLILFSFSPLCFIYFHHSIFHLTYTIFYLSYSTVGFLQGVFDLSYCIIHYAKVGPGLHVLPRSQQLRFRFSGTPQKSRLDWTCVLCPSHVQAAQATRRLVSTFSPGGVVHLITSPVPAPQFPGCAAGAPSQVCCVSPLGS